MRWMGTGEPPLNKFCRDIRARGGADSVYVDPVPLVDGSLPLRAAHDVADAIEDALQRTHPEIVDVVVHLEPQLPRKGAS